MFERVLWKTQGGNCPGDKPFLILSCSSRSSPWPKLKSSIFRRERDHVAAFPTAKAMEGAGRKDGEGRGVIFVERTWAYELLPKPYSLA